MRVTGRLRGDVRLENAREELRLVHRRGLELADLSADLEDVSLRTFQEFRFGDRRPTLLLLLAASGFVLLLACGNVAHLQLSRMASRRREIAIRRALGASAARVLRPLLLETLLLALGGATAGLWLSALLIQWLVASTPAILDFAPVLEIDARVLGFVLGTTMLVACLSVVSPALQARTISGSESLGECSSASLVWVRGGLTCQVLVVSEVALTLLAVLTSTLLIRSYNRLGTVDPGFDAAGVIAVELPGSSAGETRARDLRSLTDALLPQLEELSGVRSVGYLFACQSNLALTSIFYV